jgi:hypothetical protein
LSSKGRKSRKGYQGWKKAKGNKTKKNSRSLPGFSDALISATVSQHDKEEKAGGPDDPTDLPLNTKNHRQKLNLP